MKSKPEYPTFSLSERTRKLKKIHKITVTKLQVAERQVRAAINLLFLGKDPIAIHTLAMAGFHVLRGLAKHKTSLDYFGDYIKTEKKSEFWNHVNASSNFFKHADKDPEGVHEFILEANDATLMVCAIYLKNLDVPQSPETMAIALWFGSMHPYLLKESELKSAVNNLGLRIRHLPRKEQLNIGRILIEKQREL